MAISVAKGTKLTVGGKAVAHLTKIGSPSIKWDTVESTALDTTDDFKQFFAEYALLYLRHYAFFVYREQIHKAEFVAFFIGADDFGNGNVCLVLFVCP